MSEWINLSWKVLALRGSLAIIFGFVAMIWPISTVTALVVIWGAWALVDGAGAIIQTFTQRSGLERILLVVVAVVAIVVAFIAFTRPGLTASALTWTLGVWLIIRGCFELTGALTRKASRSRWLLALSAAVDFLLGALFVFNPGRGAVGLTVLLGAIAIVWGIVFLAMAFSVKDLAKSQPVWIEPHSS